MAFPTLADYAEICRLEAEGQGGPKIVTQFVCLPIPDRRFDWSAVTDNYEGGDPIGYGSTEAEAIADLNEQLADQAA